jgi:hypothetical protein
MNELPFASFLVPGQLSDGFPGRSYARPTICTG